MNLNEYQDKAWKFALAHATPEERVFGLLEESGEVAGIFKRIIRGDYGLPPDEVQVGTKLMKELGDCLWYLSGIAKDNGWTLQQVAEANLDKLESRKIRSMILGQGGDR